MPIEEVEAESAEEISYKKHRDPREYATKDERDAEDDFLAPARWWFITTLFPLLSGTFGFVATAFSICALAQSWRIVADPNNTTEQQGLEVTNPSWLTIVIAIALGIAVVTNLLMLMQMAEKVPYRFAAVFVIIGWWLSSALLLGLVAAAPSQLSLPSGQARTWSQAYYYAIPAAAIYGVIGTMLAITAYGVYKGRYATKFKLTTAQRTLMLQTMFFLGYVLAAAEVYNYIEGWTYLDAGLWCEVPAAWSRRWWGISQCVSRLSRCSLLALVTMLPKGTLAAALPFPWSSVAFFSSASSSDQSEH